MAKWTEPSNETHDEIMNFIISNNLDSQINTKVIVNDEQKTLFSVKKETDANKFAYGYDMKVIVNEVIFDGLDPMHRALAIEEALAGVHYDYENDKLVVSPRDKVYKSFIDKRGWDNFEVLEESIKSLYDKAKNDKNAEG
jgi:hypothetical protein